MTIDEYYDLGFSGSSYTMNNYDDMTWSAWMMGRRDAGIKTIVSACSPKDGASSKVDLHPANWG